MNISVGGVCSFHYSTDLKGWTSVTAWLQLSFIWQAMENTSLSHEVGRPKKREGFNFGSSFYMFFLLPLSLPYVNWASHEGCLFHLRVSLWFSDFLFYFFFFF